MSWFIHDPDEWVWVPGKFEAFGTYPGVDVLFGMASSGHYERRDPDEARKIKADRESAREDAVLAEADQIRARRAAEGRA